ncbi:MAG TPA: hypothetical protein VKM55_15765 [Candidatus Lokiarchaeia archaeon]|nr:hypothetical protein [Candidatus Lokiarchaeia archaeon]
MEETDASYTNQIFNFMFLGEKKAALLPFFKNFFSDKVEFSKASGIFYYPYNIPGALIRTFAAFPASLELLITPKEFGETDCIVVIVDVLNHEHFGDFVPYFNAILEKKLHCPPVILIGLVADESAPRQVSYFGMVALKGFIIRAFKPADIHYLEWKINSDPDAKQRISRIILEMKPIIEKKESWHVLQKNILKTEMRRLVKELHGWKFVDKQKGLACLISDEFTSSDTTLVSSAHFKGYSRELMIQHGLDPAFVKDILDAWESLLDDQASSADILDSLRERFPVLFDKAARPLIPRCLPVLLAKYGMTIQEGTTFLQSVREENNDVDLHQTQPIVEELSSITEFIIIFGGQPVFYHFPNQSMGIGSLTNIDLLSGMYQVLDILRNQVYISEQDEKKPVEKIKYGSLNLAIAHGNRARCIVHSIRELSDELLSKIEHYLAAFETRFEPILSNFKGETNIFNEDGKKLYDDIFTPLPVAQVNQDFCLKQILQEDKELLTNNQVKVLEAIISLQQDGIIGASFHLEDIFALIGTRVKISLSDLLLLLPGELLV